MALAAAAALLGGAGTASAAAGLSVVDKGWVTSPTHTAFGPAATRADNGDLLVAYNTDGDSIAGADAYLTRSSDGGVTWSTPSLLMTRNHWPGVGSINLALSMTTLSDGTILAPLTESIVHTAYTNRESVTYVLRSTDDGATWSGKTTPIGLPLPIYYNATYGRIVERDDGTLLMPVWGALDAPSTPTGLENPVPWQAGVLRSFDGGLSWTDYRRIGVDAVSPPSSSNPNGQFPSNVTETAITPLRDGRLLAVLRYDSTLGNGIRWQYASWSSDDGATWSDPVQTNLIGHGQDVIPAPCTSSLSGTGTKLLYGGHDPSNLHVTTRVSFDGGVRWTDPVPLDYPTGDDASGYAIYPVFVPIPGNRIFAVYGRVPGAGRKTQLAYNVLQDASGPACQTQATDAAATATATPSVYALRGDHADWAWPYASRELTAGATTTVAALAAQAGPGVSCAPGTFTLSKNGTALDPSKTLTQAGIVNGDRLAVTGSPRGRATRVGFTDLDTYPGVRPIAGWDTSCGSKLGLDFRQRSLGLDIPLTAGQQITAVSLRDSDASTRLTASDYELWTSDDARSWTKATGWTLQSTVAGGRLTHTFTGLASSKRYVKVSQRYTDAAFTFTINDSRSDVWATVTP